MQWVISPFYLLTPGEDNIDSILNRLHTYACRHYVFIHRPTTQPTVMTPENTDIIMDRMNIGCNHNSPEMTRAARMLLPRILPFCSKSNRFNQLCFAIEFSPPSILKLWGVYLCSIMNIYCSSQNPRKRVDLCGINVRRTRQYTNYTMYGSINSLW